MRLFIFLAVILSTQFLSAQYCIPTSTYGTTDNDYIDGIEVNTLSNLASGPGDGSGYSDFTAMSTDLTTGSTYSMFVQNTPDFGENYRAWIDYDQDEVFESMEELFLTFSLAAGGSTMVDFTVPLSAFPGETHMRIRCVYGTTDFDACSNESYSEAEDYTIVILGFDHDLSVVGVTLPDADCDLTTDEPVSIAIKNWGSNTESTFPVKFRVDGGPVVAELFSGSINSLEIANYTFVAGADFSADGTHTVEAWADLGSDEYEMNDTADNSVDNLFTILTTGFPPLVCYSDETIFPSPLAGGGTWSGDGIIDASTGELDPALIGGVGGSSDITYEFTAGSGYTVTEIPYYPAILVDPEELALGDDAVQDNIPIGFDFTFFGNTYSDLFVSSNGIVGFDVGDNSYTVQLIPDPATPNNFIAMCWTDLNPGDGGDISYELQGVAPNRKFIVYWDEVRHYGHEQTVSGQIILYEGTNAIDIVAMDLQSDGGNMTQGIENAGGDLAYFADPLYNKAVFSMSGRSWRYAITPCSGSVTETIAIIAPPTVYLGEDTAYCAGNTVTLDAGPGAEYYAWNTGSDEEAIIPTTTGVYWVVYTVGPGCYAIDSIDVTINANPVVDLGSDADLCEGAIIDAGNSGFDFLWNTGETTQAIFAENSGEYSVTVTNPATGCSTSDSVNYIVTEFPDASFDYESVGDLTVNFYNTTVDAETYFWDFGDGGISFEENPTHTYPFANDWEVTLTVTNKCGADISDGPVSVSVGVNNVEIQDLHVFPNPAQDVIDVDLHYANPISLAIYNATGEIVFEKTNFNSGTIDIRNLAEGNYWIRISGTENSIVKTFSIQR